VFCVCCALVHGNRRLKSLECRFRPRMQKEAGSKPSPAQPLLPNLSCHNTLLARRCIITPTCACLQIGVLFRRTELSCETSSISTPRGVRDRVHTHPQLATIQTRVATRKPLRVAAKVQDLRVATRRSLVKIRWPPLHISTEVKIVLPPPMQTPLSKLWSTTPQTGEETTRIASNETYIYIYTNVHIYIYTYIHIYIYMYTYADVC
jgi:hypothetical protein